MSEANPDASLAKRAAENYQRYFVPVIGAPVAADLIKAATLRPGERVLDVACGTGVVTRLAAEEVGPDGTVSGLDPNPGMIAVAREVTPPQASIDWHQAPAEEIPLPDESFDVVLCGMGLQFFSDKPTGLREIRRVLAPGGRFIANLPGPIPPPLKIMEACLARHVSPESAGFVQAVFSLHDPDELTSLVTDGGFEVIDIQSAMTPVDLPAPEDFLWEYVQSTPLAAEVAQVDEESRVALERDFSQQCQPFVTDGRLPGQVRMTTVIARK